MTGNTGILGEPWSQDKAALNVILATTGDIGGYVVTLHCKTSKTRHVSTDHHYLQLIESAFDLLAYCPSPLSIRICVCFVYHGTLRAWHTVGALYECLRKDFGGPVGPHSQCRGPGFNPPSEN